MTYKWVSALSYDIDDDLQVGITPVLPPSSVNNVPLRHHYDHDDYDYDDNVDVDDNDDDDMILLQSELESNFSARICERLERLQVAGNASQVDDQNCHHHQLTSPST